MTTHDQAELKRYLDALVSDTLLARLQPATTWPTFEATLGQVYFGLASFFAPAEYAEVPLVHDLGGAIRIPSEPRAAGVTVVRYVAANFRGLYQRNGRETLLAPYGELRNSQPNVVAHRTLHAKYMEALSRRAESINQLFLATTGLDAISIDFATTGASCIELPAEKRAHFTIGEEVASLWRGISQQWNEIAAGVLAAHDDKGIVATLGAQLAQTREQVENSVRRHGSNLLASTLFREWTRIPHLPELQSGTDAAARFQQWVLSLAWLAFYCHEGHAGTHFYSVRLPQILPNIPAGQGLPDSSVSLVASEVLLPATNDLWITLPAHLVTDERLTQLGERASRAFAAFVRGRVPAHLVGEEGILCRFVSEEGPGGATGPVPGAGTPPQRLPVDFKKLDFLLRMCRLLVGQSHEGHALHFCLIFGFSWERVDSESRGALTEVVSSLRNQWDRFDMKAVRKSIERKIGTWSNQLVAGDARGATLALVADGMAKWIKTGDLPLQPWDMALFFEEQGDKEWPVPTSIVRVNSSAGFDRSVVSTEFQLRGALQKLTRESHTTTATLVARGGLVLFVRGKTILLPCSGGMAYEKPFDGVRLWGDLTDQDRFTGFLDHLLRQGDFNNVGEDTRTTARDMISKLCEALVSENHGALILVRAPTDTHDLPPLNPAWAVQPNANAPPPDEGMLLYALMAALDGATEIRLPNGDGPIVFSVRKSVIPTGAVWTADGDGDATLTERFSQVDMLELVGKGTRHHSALGLSADCGDKAIVLTVSADGPVNVWQDGKRVPPPDDPKYQPRFRP